LPTRSPKRASPAPVRAEAEEGNEGGMTYSSERGTESGWRQGRQAPSPPAPPSAQSPEAIAAHLKGTEGESADAGDAGSTTPAE
jgi:hypothetical protein